MGLRHAWEWVQKKYWGFVPYRHRPAQLWYALKCWAWHRYSTVRPRWLGHTWVDRDVLLPHVMFEILGQFLERELDVRSPADPYISEPEEPEGWRVAKAEIHELWRWWNEEYLTHEDRNPIWGVAAPRLEHVATEKIGGERVFRLEQRFASPEAEKAWDSACLASHEYERAVGAELKTRCKRLIDLMDFLWT